MTLRQKFLKTVYPVYVQLSKVSEKKTRILKNDIVMPKVPFHSLYGELGNGFQMDFRAFKGKKVLVVNTASGCGFTEQFDQLQKLYKEHKQSLVVLAFPTTDFDEDKSTDEEIAIFCKENFRVTFPLMKKSVVKAGKFQNPIYHWLIEPEENGWNNQAPDWNFCKYLINEEGMLTGYFGAAIEPLGRDIMNAIENDL